MHGERHPQPGGRRAEQAAGDRADAPDAVERVEDRAAVEPLHAQPVGVLGDVDDGVQRAGDEQRDGQRGQLGAAAAAPDGDREEDQPGRGDAGGAEPADEQGRGQPGQQRAEGEGGQRRAERGVAQPQLPFSSGNRGTRFA